ESAVREGRGHLGRRVARRQARYDRRPVRGRRKADRLARSIRLAPRGAGREEDTHGWGGSLEGRAAAREPSRGARRRVVWRIRGKTEIRRRQLEAGALRILRRASVAHFRASWLQGSGESSGQCILEKTQFSSASDRGAERIARLGRP